MQGAFLHISGRWAQFRKPETNNTPLTHDFLTKTALVGLIGAALGIERTEMRAQFPTLCEDLLYGVQVRGAVQKVSWAFTLRNAHAPSEKAPRQMEFLREPDYTVALALNGERSRETFDRFLAAVQAEEACYTPVLGLHNCPASLEWERGTAFEKADGEFTTLGFAPRKDIQLRTKEGMRLHFERIPTYQDADWWNPPKHYVEVIYPSNGATVTLEREHWISQEGDAWCLI